MFRLYATNAIRLLWPLCCLLPLFTYSGLHRAQGGEVDVLWRAMSADGGQNDHQWSVINKTAKFQTETFSSVRCEVWLVPEGDISLLSLW